MNDDQFDELLRSAGRDYNAPPPVPREAMWARIAEARAEARAGAHGAPPDDAGAAPDVVSLDAERARRASRPWRRHAGWAAGLAATLLVGVGLGRLSSNRAAKPAAVAASPAPSLGSDRVALAPSVSAPPSVSTPPSASPASSEPTPPPVAPAPVRVASADASRGARVERPVGGRAASGAARADESPSERRAPSAALPFRVAAVEHLATTEALLVALRADGRAGTPDTSVARWAGDLLGTTRQLLDSPASADPQIRRLLEDLELVLAQIARLPGAGQPRERQSELDLIDQALQRRHVLTRLRTLDART